MSDTLKPDLPRRDDLAGQLWELWRQGQRPDLSAFLASAESDYVTGTTYFVDGGLTWNYQEQ